MFVEGRSQAERRSAAAETAAWNLQRAGSAFSVPGTVREDRQGLCLSPSFGGKTLRKGGGKTTLRSRLRRANGVPPIERQKTLMQPGMAEFLIRRGVKPPRLGGKRFEENGLPPPFLRVFPPKDSGNTAKGMPVLPGGPWHGKCIGRVRRFHAAVSAGGDRSGRRLAECSGRDSWTRSGVWSAGDRGVNRARGVTVGGDGGKVPLAGAVSCGPGLGVRLDVKGFAWGRDRVGRRCGCKLRSEAVRSC